MGIIRAAVQSVSSALADQWLEVIEPNEMGETTVMTDGTAVRRDSKKGQNRKGTPGVISNGSVIHVYPNQFMLLVDGGRVIDYTAEEGYYTVDNSSEPSLFNGQFGDALQAAFDRVRFGGAAPTSQKVYYINLQEIKGIKFGTRTPINYFDNFYNAELFLRTHGTYSVKIVNPLLFFREAVPRNRQRVEMQDINEQFFNEFMEALQSAINQMSADGIRISYVSSKGRELGNYMADILDEEWEKLRGIQVQSVGIASISYDEESTRLIHMRNEGAMLGDPSVREGYVQGAVARGMQAAGSNSGGAMAGFMGMNMAMNAGGSVMGAASASNQAQMAQQAQQQAQAKPSADEWVCSCGAKNTGKFCSECGGAKPAKPGEWKCPECGKENHGNFCSECGTKRPGGLKCDKCGYVPDPNAPAPKFCPECGDPFDERDRAE